MKIEEDPLNMLHAQQEEEAHGKGKVNKDVSRDTKLVC